MRKNREETNERKIKFIGIDDWGRKVYQDIDSKRICKDIDCINYSGQFYTSDRFDGEPDCPLREDLKIIIIENLEKVTDI